MADKAPDQNEQMRPFHKWSEETAAIDHDIRALGFFTLVDPEGAGYWCWGAGTLPRVIHLRMLANGQKLGNKVGFDLLAEAGMSLDDGEFTYTKR